MKVVPFGKNFKNISNETDIEHESITLEELDKYVDEIEEAPAKVTSSNLLVMLDAPEESEVNLALSYISLCMDNLENQFNRIICYTSVVIDDSIKSNSKIEIHDDNDVSNSIIINPDDIVICIGLPEESSNELLLQFPEQVICADLNDTDSINTALKVLAISYGLSNKEEFLRYLDMI